MASSPEQPISYRRELALRLKSTLWEQRFLLCSITLGQFLSLCLCGTGVTSELLEERYDISVPTTQAFLNYVLLALTFGTYLATKKKFLTILKYNWWKYIILGAVDVEANYLFILAYKYTNMTSIQLLDCFTIACVMVLSYVFLKTRYKLINIMGVLLTLIGIGSLVIADLDSPRNTGGSNKFLGDMLCLIGAALYAAVNVSQEFLVKSHSIVEYLGLIGVVGSFVSGAQLIGLERMNIARIEWSAAVGGLFSGFGFSMYLFYAVTPLVMRLSSAVVFNLSLLTADFYTLMFGLFLFDYRFSGFYVMGFVLVILGIFIYNLKPPVEKRLRERSLQERRRKSIDRRFSVAPTKVDSDDDSETSRWEIRGLLETSTETIASISAIKRSGKYGTTEMLIPGAEDRYGFIPVTPQDHTHLHPYHLSPRGGPALDKKYPHGDGKGRKTLMKQNGAIGQPPPRREGEGEGEIYTRVVSIEIARGNSVRFSQSAPSVVPGINFATPGRRVVSPLAKKEEKREEKKKEQKEGEEEEEEGKEDTRSGKRERGRRRQKTLSRKREGSSSSRSQEEGKSLSPPPRGRPKRRDNLSRRKESSSRIERDVPSKHGSSDLAMRQEVTSEGGLERGSPPLEHAALLQRESSPAKLRESSPDDLRDDLPTVIIMSEEEEHSSCVRGEVSSQLSSRTESHRGSGGSGSIGDPLEALPCEQVFLHDPDSGGGAISPVGGGGRRGELSEVEEEEEGREEREKH